MMKQALLAACARTLIIGTMMAGSLAVPAAAQQAAPDAAMATVLADPRRGEDGARDQYRHPAETLAFFQVQPGMTVADYLPAGGWYTRVLVPYLGTSGHYIGLGPNVSGGSARQQESMGNLATSFPAQAAQWNLGQGAQISACNVDVCPDTLDGMVDRVLVFREFHNQLRFGWLHNDLVTIRRLLKPGGMVGMIDHRAPEDAPYSRTNGSAGYVRQSDVIAIMDAYGFDLVGESEINANPRDTKDYPGGVWTLPPSLRDATDETRPGLLAIGESDRMTLLFRKRD